MSHVLDSKPRMTGCSALDFGQVASIPNDYLEDWRIGEYRPFCSEHERLFVETFVKFPKEEESTTEDSPN